MKAINYLYTFLVCGLLYTCANDDIDKTFTSSDDQFVRFFMLVDNNNEVLEYPQISGGLIPVETYTKTDLRTLKIPVALSVAEITEDITADFQYSFTGNLDETDFEILPNSNSIIFSEGKLIDTIVVNQKTRITDSNTGKLNLELTSVNNPNVSIGINNNEAPNKTLEISLNPTEGIIMLFEKSREEIQGLAGETFDFKVLFPNGFIASEVDGVNLFGITSAFDIDIVQQPLTADNTEIVYTATINEDLPEDSSFDSLLNLIDIEGYTQGAITCYQISKPIQIERSGNPAANFYDLSDPFFRLRGDYWRVDNEDPDGCEWFNHNIFSVPVIVAADDPNGILYDDRGTTDTSDDIYHHRYKIGFVSPNAPIGTNPFAMRNLLVGEAVSSPGFNLTEAIEFFPENGDSLTGGAIAVVSQKAVVIRTADDMAFNIPLSGSGTYELVDEATNLWRMHINVTYDFSAIDGSTHTIPIVLYNQPGQPDPELSSSSCFEPIEL